MAANESTKYTHFSNVSIGTTTGGGGLDIAGVAMTASSAELNVLDGVTAGTVTASKALVVDANKDIATLRHVTLSGNIVQGATTISEADIAQIDGITAGTVTASKAVVVDANKDISEFRNLTATNHIVGVGGTINSDSGTATATAGAATLSKMAGVVTSEALTTAAGAEYTLTVTNTVVAAADIVLCSVANGTNTTASPVITTVTPGAGSFVVNVWNEHASAALNGTILVSFLVVKA